MHAKLFQLRSFIAYWLDAVSEYSLHSPFLFDFYIRFLKQKPAPRRVDSLHQVRKKLQSNHHIIHVNDLGAGSLHFKNSERKISAIARTSATPEKFSKLYSNLISHYRFAHVIELGTSLGINALYLAKAHDSVQVITFEGSPEVAKVALSLFAENKVENVKLIEGNIDGTLPNHLATMEKIDFALIDANHRFEPTLQYFHWIVKKTHAYSIIVLDDIHYSAEMERAWYAIQSHELVYTTVDLYRCGLVLLNPSLTKQNVVLQF